MAVLEVEMRNSFADHEKIFEKFDRVSDQFSQVAKDQAGIVRASDRAQFFNRILWPTVTVESSIIAALLAIVLH